MFKTSWNLQKKHAAKAAHWAAINTLDVCFCMLKIKTEMIAGDIKSAYNPPYINKSNYPEGG